MALGLREAAGEVATKVQVHDDAITGHDHLFDLASDIRDRRMHQRGGCQWSGEPLRAPSRQGPVGEVVRQCGARERLPYSFTLSATETAFVFIRATRS